MKKILCLKMSTKYNKDNIEKNKYDASTKDKILGFLDRLFAKAQHKEHISGKWKIITVRINIQYILFIVISSVLCIVLWDIKFWSDKR